MIVFEQLIPVLRIFDVEKAKEFYAGFVGFNIDLEHRFDGNSPLYMQVSGVEDQRPDLPFKVMNVIDPFGNRIRFPEPV